MLDVLDPIFSALARLMVARGILFSELSEWMKSHYVDAAKSQVEGKVTDSRLSVLTGLQRRDIVRLRDRQERQSRSNHLARLVALWHMSDGYHENGQPIPLAKNGPAPSFEALAREVRKDVHPRTMLDALELSGTVSVGSNGWISLLHGSYQPLAGTDDQLSYLARNMADHMSAASENVQGHQPPHFERAVHYTGLTEAQVSELSHAYESGQMKLFLDLSRTAAEMKSKNSKSERFRFRAGGYFYRKQESDS